MVPTCGHCGTTDADADAGFVGRAWLGGHQRGWCFGWLGLWCVGCGVGRDGVEEREGWRREVQVQVQEQDYSCGGGGWGWAEAVVWWFGGTAGKEVCGEACVGAGVARPCRRGGVVKMTSWRVVCRPAVSERMTSTVVMGVMEPGSTSDLGLTTSVDGLESSEGGSKGC